MHKYVSILAAAIACLMIIACTDLVTEHYKTYDEAIRAGAATRGWLPYFTPNTASDIDLIHDLDTNQQWFHFKVSMDFVASITKDMKVTSLSEIKKKKIIKPKGIKWPAELDEIMYVTPRASFHFFNSCASKACLCIAIDSSMGDVFGWTCQPE